MKTTADYLDELRAKTGAKSDGAAGLTIGWARPSISHYRNQKTTFDNLACLQLAKALKLPIIQIIADMELIRNTDPKRRTPWLPYASKTTKNEDREGNETKHNNVISKMTAHTKTA